MNIASLQLLIELFPWYALECGESSRTSSEAGGGESGDGGGRGEVGRSEDGSVVAVGGEGGERQEENGDLSGGDMLGPAVREPCEWSVLWVGSVYIII